MLYAACRILYDTPTRPKINLALPNGRNDDSAHTPSSARTRNTKTPKTPQIVTQGLIGWILERAQANFESSILAAHLKANTKGGLSPRKEPEFKPAGVCTLGRLESSLGRQLASSCSEGVVVRAGVGLSHTLLTNAELAVRRGHGIGGSCLCMPSR